VTPAVAVCCVVRPLRRVQHERTSSNFSALAHSSKTPSRMAASQKMSHCRFTISVFKSSESPTPIVQDRRRGNAYILSCTMRRLRNYLCNRSYNAYSNWVGQSQGAGGAAK
jgi:hypothetical protein